MQMLRLAGQAVAAESLGPVLVAADVVMMARAVLVGRAEMAQSGFLHGR